MNCSECRFDLHFLVNGLGFRSGQSICSFMVQGLGFQSGWVGVFPHWHCEKSFFDRVKVSLRLAGQASDNKVQGCEQNQADRPDNQSANERERESWLPGERERERQRPPGQGQEVKQATQGERERENGRQGKTKGPERDP
jgi:hypothetical protein